MAACESCFGEYLDRLVGGEFLPSGCTVEWEEDDQDGIAFFLHDKDGQNKILMVNQANWLDACNSWSRLLAKQERARV